MFTRLRLALTSLFAWIELVTRPNIPTRSQLPAAASSAAALASEREKATAAAVARLEKALAEAKEAQAELKESVDTLRCEVSVACLKIHDNAYRYAKDGGNNPNPEEVEKLEAFAMKMKEDRAAEQARLAEQVALFEAAAKFASRVEFGAAPEIAKMALNQAENAEQRKDFEKRWNEAKRATIRLMREQERDAEFAANGYEERRDAVLATHLKFIDPLGYLQDPEKRWAEAKQEAVQKLEASPVSEAIKNLPTLTMEQAWIEHRKKTERKAAEFLKVIEGSKDEPDSFKNFEMKMVRQLKEARELFADRELQGMYHYDAKATFEALGEFMGYGPGNSKLFLSADNPPGVKLTELMALELTSHLRGLRVYAMEDWCLQLSGQRSDGRLAEFAMTTSGDLCARWAPTETKKGSRWGVVATGGAKDIKSRIITNIEKQKEFYPDDVLPSQSRFASTAAIELSNSLPDT